MDRYPNDLDDDEPPQKRERRVNRYLLSIIQISVCVLILLAAVVLKLWGGAWYTAAREWYVENLNDSIVAQEKLDGVAHGLVELLPEKSTASQASSQGAAQTESAPDGSAAP